MYSPQPSLAFLGCRHKQRRLKTRRVNAAQKAIIETDFGMTQGQLVVSSRRALVKYVLQRYQIDHRNMAILPEAQQLVVSNLQELQPWLMKY